MKIQKEALNMSVTVYGTFYSPEAADKAAAAVEKSVRGASLESLCAKSGASADESGLSAFFSFPVLTAGTQNAAVPLPMDLSLSSQADDVEPSRSRCVTLSVSTSNKSGADAVISVMHNAGGYDVHKAL
jgi:hypothetical protein